MSYSHYEYDELSKKHQEELGHKTSAIPWIIVGLILIIAFA